MDRVVNVASSGAMQIMQEQAVHMHNLANQKTSGFREDIVVLQSQFLEGSELNTRTFSSTLPNQTNFTHGAINTTARELDVAIKEEGWFAVKTPLGDEAYTRNGEFQINAKGELVTSEGYPVLGKGDSILIPISDKIEIAEDGRISIAPAGQGSINLVVIDQIKLVNPDTKTLYKKQDGYFYRQDNKKSSADPKVLIASGALESSNVDALGTMMRIIDLSRQYEAQMKMMKISEDMADNSSSLVGM